MEIRICVTYSAENRVDILICPQNKKKNHCNWCHHLIRPSHPGPLSGMSHYSETSNEIGS